MKVSGIYLAAGASRRMGRPKLSIPVGSGSGAKLGALALLEALRSGLDELIVVTAPDRPLDWLPAAATPGMERCRVTIAHEAIDGMANSIIAGVREVMTGGSVPDAIVILLADQPRVTAAMIAELIDRFAQLPDADYIAFADEGIAKPPVLFSPSMIPALLELRGDMGARKLLTNPAFRGIRVEGVSGEHFWDMDTAEDWNMFKAYIDKSGGEPI